MNRPGFSSITPIKQQQFREILNTQIACCYHIIKKNEYPQWNSRAYHYIDFTAGAGIDESGSDGSPLIFLDVVRRYPVDCNILLIEKNKRTHKQLLENVKKRVDYMMTINNYSSKIDINIHKGNHHEVLKQYLEFPDHKKRFGLAYMDTNGKPSFDVLAELSHVPNYDKMDILMNCSATTVKRSGPNNPICQGKTLVEYLRMIDKRYIMIREPYGKMQWSFILATNWVNMPQFKKIGMYPVTAPEGSAILKKLNNTNGEGLCR